MNEDQILRVLALRALQDEENAIDGSEAALPGALAGSALGVTAGVPGHYLGQKKLDKMDKENPFYEVTKRDAVGAPLAMNAKGAIPRRELAGHRVRPGARMAGGLMGAMVGGALGAGTAELVKRESPAARLIAKIQTQNGRMSPQDICRAPAARLIAKIQTQNGRLTSSDAAQLQSLLTDTYSNISDYRS